ncbi:MAG: hypothetical protein AAGA92_16195 [Planctomycetota bacterium]
MPNDSPKPLLPTILSLVSLHDDPKWNTYPPLRKAVKVNTQVSGAVDQLWDRLDSPDTSDAVVDELADALVALHVKYIVPLDIPGIGPVVEAIVDNQIGKLIPAVVDRVHQRLKALPSLTSSAA